MALNLLIDKLTFILKFQQNMEGMVFQMPYTLPLLILFLPPQPLRPVPVPRK